MSDGTATRTRLGPSFSIATISRGTPRLEYMGSMLAVQAHEHLLQRTHDPLTPRVHFDQWYGHLAAPYLDDERNRCIEWFKGTTTNHPIGSDYLIFIDDDVRLHDPQQLFDLVQLAVDNDTYLLGGVYYSLFPQLAPVVYRFTDPADLADSSHAFTNHTVEWVDEQKDDVTPVDAMGAGLMCIDTRLLDLISETFAPADSCTPWFAEVSWGGVHLGEDFTFCARATHVGHRPHIAPRIQVDHYKMSLIRSPNSPPIQEAQSA